MHHLNTPAQLILPTPCSADYELYTCASTQQTEFNNNPEPFQQRMFHILSSVLSAQKYSNIHGTKHFLLQVSVKINSVYTEIYQNSIYATPLKTQIDYLLSKKQYSYKPKQ